MVRKADKTLKKKCTVVLGTSPVSKKVGKTKEGKTFKIMGSRLLLWKKRWTRKRSCFCYSSRRKKNQRALVQGVQIGDCILFDPSKFIKKFNRVYSSIPKNILSWDNMFIPKHNEQINFKKKFQLKIHRNGQVQNPKYGSWVN